MRRTTQLSVAALAALCIAGVPTPAGADPTGAKNASVFDLVCDDGTTTEIVVNGNGNWTPGHDLGSNAIFVPVSFGEVTGTVTDTEGDVVDTFTEPPATKGSGKHADLQCMFSGTFSFPDPDLGLLTVTVSGDVAGFRTPRN
jgi:hypothetical protein